MLRVAVLHLLLSGQRSARRGGPGPSGEPPAAPGRQDRAGDGGVRASSVGEQTLSVCFLYIFFFFGDFRSHRNSVACSEIAADGNRQTHEVEVCFSRSLLFCLIGIGKLLLLFFVVVLR